MFKAGAVSRACYPHSYITSSGDAVLVTHCFTPLMMTFLNAVKQFYHDHHIYNASVDYIASYIFDFDTSDWWNLAQTVPVIDVEDTVTRTHLCTSRNYLTPVAPFTNMV